MSSNSEFDAPTEPIGVRWPAELPDANVDPADEPAPALEPARKDERSDQEAADASPGSVSSDGADDTSVDQATSAEKEQERKTATVSEVAVTPPAVDSDTAAGDGMPPDRPKKPVLAAVAIGGAVVLAIPLLLIGAGSHGHKKQRTANAANTVLPGDGRRPGTFSSASPTATPSPSASAKKKKAKPKPSKSVEPKTSPSARTQTVSNQRPLASAPASLRLHAPRDIYPGKTVRTNRIALTMQTGGNLVLRDRSNKIIWSTGTHKPGVYAELQTDGNLVLYGGDRQAVWAAGCFGHSDPTMVLQSDSNMVILDSGGHPIWATGTNR